MASENTNGKKSYNWSLIITIVIHIITASIYVGFTVGQFSELREDIGKLESKIEKQTDERYRSVDAKKDLDLRDRRMDLLELRLQNLERIHLKTP